MISFSQKRKEEESAGTQILREHSLCSILFPPYWTSALGGCDNSALSFSERVGSCIYCFALSLLFTHCLLAFLKLSLGLALGCQSESESEPTMSKLAHKLASAMCINSFHCTYLKLLTTDVYQILPQNILRYQ